MVTELDPEIEPAKVVSGVDVPNVRLFAPRRIRLPATPLRSPRRKEPTAVLRLSNAPEAVMSTLVPEGSEAKLLICKVPLLIVVVPR